MSCGLSEIKKPLLALNMTPCNLCFMSANICVWHMLIHQNKTILVFGGEYTSIATASVHVTVRALIKWSVIVGLQPMSFH